MRHDPMTKGKVFSLTLALLLIVGVGHLTSRTQAESAEVSAPLGTLPLGADGVASYAIQVLEGAYYLGMAVAEGSNSLSANLTLNSTPVVTEEVSYWGARRIIHLTTDTYNLELRGHGAAIIASNAQWPGTYAFAGMSTASFFLLPRGSALTIKLALDTPSSAQLLVYDGLMTVVKDASISSGSEWIFDVTLSGDRADFAYIGITSQGNAVAGVLTWSSSQSGQPSERSDSGAGWLVVVVVGAILAAVLLLTRRGTARRRIRR